MSDRRKLLFYLHGLSGGGAERVFARLASGFAARGDRVIFAVDYEADENRAFLSDKVDLRVLPPGHGRSILALASLLRRERPDASLSALSMATCKHTAAALLAGQVSRTILTFHGFFENESRGLAYRLAPAVTRIAAASVAVSEALSEDLIARFHVPKDRLRIIYNPAAPEPFPPHLEPGALENRAENVLAIGRLVPDKGFSALLRAFALVRRPNAQLTILGEGPERKRLEEEARRLGIFDRVSMPGFQSDVGAYFQRARCYGLASHFESFSLSCVEALSYGLPVVATAGGGPHMIVNKPELGRILPMGDVQGMADALEAMLANPGDPAPRQKRAQDFSLEAALDAYDGVIRSVMG